MSDKHIHHNHNDPNHVCACHSNLEGTSCSSNKNRCCGGKLTSNMLSDEEKHFLAHLLERLYLPVSQFVLKSSKESAFASVTLSPVFIIEEKDTMEQVKDFGKMLKALEEKGFISLDFDIPIDNYDYKEYTNSSIFTYFKECVEEGKTKDGFLGDLAVIAKGSIAPTEDCKELFSTI